MSIGLLRGVNKKSQQGITLIEVLVALLVLSIGLVGLAALQLNSLRFNHSAFLRTQSTVLAYDIIDSMRVNRDKARDGVYNVSTGSCTTCSTNALANTDLVRWKASLAASLPAGDGSVSTLATGATRVVQVTVQWAENRGDISGTQSLTVEAEI
ncbi:Type IV fimbrial biogenesis protein PilV [gamma proteobacterium IMCC2047]|nr:Type IV fimbrial biogenesis protein PilV [gamma proteobacterium IMCC2047]